MNSAESASNKLALCTCSSAAGRGQPGRGIPALVVRALCLERVLPGKTTTEPSWPVQLSFLQPQFRTNILFLTQRLLPLDKPNTPEAHILNQQTDLLPFPESVSQQCPGQDRVRALSLDHDPDRAAWKSTRMEGFPGVRAPHPTPPAASSPAAWLSLALGR